MTRIVCPHCHTPLAINELELLVIDGQQHRACPECTAVLIQDATQTLIPAAHQEGALFV